MARQFLTGIGLAIALTCAVGPALAQSNTTAGQGADSNTHPMLETTTTPPFVASDPSNEFANWAVAVVAADWRSSQGQPIHAFENSRRDLFAAFDRAGFATDNMTALSLAPAADGTFLGAQRAFAAIESVARRGAAGCLLYFTSHGSPAGIVWGPDGMMPPAMMNQLINRWCGTRPTVVVVSACYSGVFVPALAQPNRMIMTAARRDRSSFGCSEDATYPYFDGCVLEALDEARDFLSLSMRATACVNRREREEGLRPPSEPQTYVGAQMQALLPFLQFSAP